MSTWDRLGKAQAALPSSNAPGGRGYYVPFGAGMDVAKSLPDKPYSWNDSVEQLRVGTLETAGQIAGPVLSNTIGRADKATGGAITKTLMAAPYQVRSNYAFVRDLGNESIGMSLLAGLGLVAAAVAGGAAAVAVGAPLLAVSGAAALTAGAAGMIQRNVAKTGALGEAPQKSAQLAVTKAGQEKYNFGRDVVKVAAKIAGNDDPNVANKGVGAVTSGLLNLTFEVGTGMDVGAAKILGAGIRRGVSAPLADPGFSLLRVNKGMREYEAGLKDARIAEDIDLLKRTANGEKTAYTPLFEFLQKSDPATIQSRKEFQNEVGLYAANVLSGADFDSIALVLRAGRGDKEAIDFLKATRADINNKLSRYEGQIQMVEDFDGVVFAKYRGDNITLGPLEFLEDNNNLIRQEIQSLRTQHKWLDDSLQLESALQDKTVGKWAWVEKTKNDMARFRAERKLEQKGQQAYETGLGGALHSMYQESAFSPIIRFVDRSVDDIPREVINFNDPIQIPTRLRTNLRAAVVHAGMLPEVTTDIYNRFLKAADETQRYTIVKEYTDSLAIHLGEKYGIHGSKIETILDAYDRAHGDAISRARSAYDQSTGFAIAPNGEIIADPQLISQLANGAALPNPQKWDAAFKRYAEKYGADASVPLKTAYGTRRLLDEFNSLWRTQTLMRGGYPGNVIRDSAVRIYGDAALIPVLTNLSKDTMEKIFNTNNTVNKIKDAYKGLNPKNNLENIRKDIREREIVMKEVKKQLEDSGYDFANPPKVLSNSQQKALSVYNTIDTVVNEFRRQEKTIIEGKSYKPVGRDKSINVFGYEFPSHFGGRFGEISESVVRGKDDIRRAVSSVKELALENISRSTGGTKAVLPTVDEALHLREWEHTLKDLLGFDDVARLIMSGKGRQEVIRWIRSPENRQYLERFNLDSTQAGVVYERVKHMVDMYANTPQLRVLILENRVTKDELIKLYPDKNQRPTLLTDMVRDNLARSTKYQQITGGMKDIVAWLSTAPTSKLMYNPYFQYKYEEKLHNMVYIANKQGRILDDADRAHFEKVARNYAIREFREKLNSFHRDMNYAGWFNYIVAFFPAFVEQMRAYGRIAAEHPDFLFKAAQVSLIPERIGEQKEDSYGNKYTEIELPVLGGMKARVSNSWFNVFNPTGSTLISAHPIASFSVNEAAKRTDLPKKLEAWALPYGVQADSWRLATPSVTSKTFQLFQATLTRNGDKFNKDANMFLKELITEYMIDNNGFKPSGSKLAELSKIAEDRAVALSWLRFSSQLILPSQPRYVTRLTGYQDIYSKMVENDPVNGEEQFIAKYPDYWLVTDSLSNSFSGIVSDETAVSLAKISPDVIRKISSTVGAKNIAVLGAVYNDDNYAFSSKAQAWLLKNNIPGTSNKFKEYTNYLESSRSAVVAKGWSDYTKVKDIITKELENQGYTTAEGYGAAVLKRYKDAYVASTQESNPIWYEEFVNSSFGGRGSRQAAAVTALTIAANTPKLWDKLKQQPRWTTIVNYLNLRYEVYDELAKRGGFKPTGELNLDIENSKVKDLKRRVDAVVAQMRKDDVMFAKFYDRYFDGDKFDYVYEEGK